MDKALSEHIEILSNFPELPSLDGYSSAEHENEGESRMRELYIRNQLIQNVSNLVTTKEKIKAIPELIAVDPELLREQVKKRKTQHSNRMS